MEERVKGPRNPLLAIIFVFAVSVLAFSSATDVYITPDGSSQGVCTSSPQPPAWFNSASNWGSSTSQIGPGTTVHLCGAFSGAAASNVLTTQGNGTSGSPITIKFEAGATIKAPSCGTFSTNPTGGCIKVQNQWITVDGNNTGVIQNMFNGSSGNACPGGTCNLNNPTSGVYVGASNVVVKNLTVADMYDRIPCNNSTGERESTGVAVDGASGNAFTNVTVSGMTIHDAGNSVVLIGGSNNISNMTVTKNTLYHASAEVVLAEGGGGGTASNITVSFNNIYDNYYWWDPADNDHLNGMHLFAAAPGTSMTGVIVDDNYIHGDFGGKTCGGGGSHTTAFIFFETTGGGTATGAKIFNNLLVSGLNDDASNGLLNVGDNNDSGAQIYHNTIVGTNDGSGYCLMGAGAFTWQNNICSGEAYVLYANGPGRSQITASDNNNYYQNSTGFRLGSNFYSFSAWQGLGFDTHGSNSNPNLDSSYKPQSGSPAIGLGANLTNLGIQSLDSDMAGAARPGCGTTCPAWDAGVYNYGAGDPPSPPTGLAAVVN
jgi:hypothetical protein